MNSSKTFTSLILLILAVEASAQTKPFVNATGTSQSALNESTQVAKEDGCRYSAVKLNYVSEKRTDVTICRVDSECEALIAILNPSRIQSRTSLQITTSALPNEVRAISFTMFNDRVGKTTAGARCRVDRAIEELKKLF